METHKEEREREKERENPYPTLLLPSFFRAGASCDAGDTLQAPSPLFGGRKEKKKQEEEGGKGRATF